MMKPLFNILRNQSKHFIALIGLPCLLSGCMGMNNKFDCPMKPGVMCASLDNVNTMVNQGKLGNKDAAPSMGSPSTNCPNCASSSSNASKVPNTQLTTSYPIGINPGDPLRYGETVMRVWIAPFEDTEGNYYEPSVLYTIVKPGHWIGNPVQAVNNADGDDK